MSKNLEETLHEIDDGLEKLHTVYLTGDRRRCLEDELWTGLLESVDMGWYSLEEAEEMFINWRNKYLGDSTT